MSRSVFLLIFPSPLFPAHWSIFIPSLASDNDGTNKSSRIGTRIHVHGNAMSGFVHEFVRNYDRDTSGDRMVRLADVEGRYLHDYDDDEIGGTPDGNSDVKGGDGGAETRDVEARNELERVALDCPAPGPSLNPLGKTVSGKRVEIQNCQTWLRQLVAQYVDKGIMGAGALEAVDGAPKN